ncbi:MAG: hypothetical protein WDO24_26660 [Pseudomonadota bacterium]
MILERPAVGAARLRDVLRDLDRHSLGNGLVGALIATTGPLAIMLAALQRGGLGVAEITAYVVAAYVSAASRRSCAASRSANSRRGLYDSGHRAGRRRDRPSQLR